MSITFFWCKCKVPCLVYVLSLSLYIDYLCSIRANLIQGSNSAIQKANYFIEIVISNTPWPIHQEREVSFGCFAHWEGKASVLELEQHLNSSGNLISYLRKYYCDEKPFLKVS